MGMLKRVAPLYNKLYDAAKAAMVPLPGGRPCAKRWCRGPVVPLASCALMAAKVCRRALGKGSAGCVPVQLGRLCSCPTPCRRPLCPPTTCSRGCGHPEARGLALPL